MQALPATFRQHAEAAAGAVVLDPSGWDHTVAAAHDHLEPLQRAVIGGVQVELDYRGRDGRASSRTVHPLGLVVKNTTWYLIAGTDAGQRTFRVSRVRSLRLTAHAAARPDDFDLAQAWSSIVTTVDARRAPVRLRAGPTVVDVLRYLFGNRVGDCEEGSDG